ncbi:hypothetical protein [Ornithinibacillus scapharcae]|uniref:hypothetical protein n=1 Tax=Ornithinibacillus scapharcae TaxID=1147159 RepID=UPI000225BC9A|nr:hypothetical protein [Ornithinibacillus scapharcae]
MKKWLIIIGVIIVVVVITFVNKYYYPDLPIDTVSKKEVLDTLYDSSEDIVKIAEEQDYDWYITRMEQGKAYENLKNLITKSGWEFQQHDGSGYFFEKDDKTLIATTQMWTENYVMVKIPSDWRK